VPRKIVIIPTYNERQNVPALVPEVLAQDPEIEILIVDDSSPDGTGAVVTDMGAREPRLHLLTRHVRQGLGPAYKDGFRWAIAHDADLVVQMDADFSHDPAMLPRFFADIAGYDLVLGSRYVQGITVVNWPIERLLLSYFGNAYTRRVLGMTVRDATGGFKCWRRTALEAIDLEDVRSNGYAFQIETTYRAVRAGFSVVEVPIIFADREQGGSKMSRAIVLEAIWRVPLLRLAALLGRL
jgi:dolichol-phosphate mannosyltransferase